MVWAGQRQYSPSGGLEPAHPDSAQHVRKGRQIGHPAAIGRLVVELRSHGSKKIEVIEVPEPQPGPGRVKPKVGFNGICGTAPSANRWKPQHNPSPAEMRALFEGAGFAVRDQHRVRRPTWTRIVSDLITVGTKS
jgi:hypothetical protein